MKNVDFDFDSSLNYVPRVLDSRAIQLQYSSDLWSWSADCCFKKTKNSLLWYSLYIICFAL